MSQLATTQSSAIGRPGWTQSDVETLKRTVARGCTDAQFSLFCQVIGRTQLDPFTKQIYAIVRGGDMTIQTGIDGYRLQAQRTGQYAGQIGPQWCGKDGQWVDVWTDDTLPVAARVGVVRSNFADPVWGVALMREYGANGPKWKSMPVHMLAKCAEALALRKAFPAELSGIYTDDEMDQADGRGTLPDRPQRKTFREKVGGPKPVSNVAEVVEQAPPVPVADEPGPSGDEPQTVIVIPDIDWANFPVFTQACETRAQELGMSPSAFEALKAECLAKTGKESWMQVAPAARKRFYEVIGERCK